jgi:ankyrin repeat protein
MRDDFNNPAAPLHLETKSLTQSLRRDEAPRLSEVQRYLDQGVAVDAIVINKESFLTLAAFWGHADIAAELIRRGAPLDHQNHMGETALIHALRRGHKEIAVMLLDAGASVLRRGDQEWSYSVRSAAERHDWPDVMAKIEEKMAVQLPALAAEATVLQSALKPLPTLRFKAC